MAFISAAAELTANGRTQIENKFITKYLPVLDARAVKVYLLALYACGGGLKNYTLEDFARKLEMSADEVANYFDYLFFVWWAQYEFLDAEYESGIDAYNKFWSLNDTDPDGYTVYQQPGLEKAFEVLQSLFSEKTFFINGSETKSHTDSQVDFVLERAAMLPCGGWLQNEMKEHYSDKKNYRMMKTPVISALGKELKLAGDAATDAQHEEKLVAVVKAVDAGKDAAAIATELGVDVSKAQTVLAARNLSATIGINHQVWIPATSNAKENAKKF